MKQRTVIEKAENGVRKDALIGYSYQDEELVVKRVYEAVTASVRKLNYWKAEEEELIQEAVAVIFTHKFAHCPEELERICMTGEDKALLHQIAKNAVTDFIHEKVNKHAHEELLMEDRGLKAGEDIENSNASKSHNYKDLSIEWDESTLGVKEILEKLEGNETERKYLILKSYIAGLEMAEFLQLGDEELIKAYESNRESGKREENAISEALGLGYSGNSKYRSFVSDLREFISIRHLGGEELSSFLS